MNDSIISTLKILVIDDDPDAREILQIILEEQNATLYLAKDGREGFDIAARESLDLIISDIAMPNVSGWDFIRMIRSLPNKANTPIIALTAFTDSYSRRRAEAAGFRHFLTKPIDVAAFAPELAQIYAELTGREKSDD